MRKTKKNHYANLNQKDIADNKQFWRTVKPLLSDKSKSNEKITLVEGDKITSEDKSNAEILNSFFSNAVKNLKIPEFNDINPLAENIPHPAFKAILKYKNHSSIMAIKNARRNGLGFYFGEVSVGDICKELRRLNPRKAAQNTDIPIKILKENADIFSSYICDFFNETIRSGKFPSILKKANITPVFKKGFKGSKENYRPVSILPVTSKIFEKMISKQITSFMDPLLSKYQCGFRRGFSAQNCLLATLEKWKSSVDKGKVFGVLLTDLSKAFDCLSHELIIAKLNAYGFSLSALKLMQNYLVERKERTKINQAYSSWEEILFGVPQGSILGPILFNIFLSDLFLVVQNVDFASYAGDNTIYNSSENIDDVILSLQESSKQLFKWFSDNQMKSNSDKCHLIVSKNDTTEIQIGDSVIKSSSTEKLLGVNIDCKLNFDSHVKHLCNKANKKLRALARVTPYMTLEKKKIIMNSFFNAQFNYRPLIWMLHSRKNNNKIKYLHERCLRLIYSDKKSSYEKLLEKDGSVSIHHRNIQALAIEMFKVKHKLCPEITSDIFMERTNYHFNLRNRSDFITPQVNSVYHGTESITYLGPKIWDMVPDSIKEEKSLNSFKESIKLWVPINCPCRLCKVYLDGVGFI